MLTILSFVVVFLILTLSHELGHFIVAKKSGIRVYEFAIGIGPRLFSFTKNSTIYALNLFPIGGYVRLAGMGVDAEDKDCPPQEQYVNKGIWPRFLTIIAGATMNIFTAFIIFTLILIFVGIPKDVSNEVAAVSPKSPAAKAGLLPKDKILAINGQLVTNPKLMVEKIHQSANKKIELTILRQGKKLQISGTPIYNKEMKAALLGFSLKPIYQPVGFFKALWLGGKQTITVCGFMLYSLWLLVSGQVSLAHVAGPVGIAQITGQQSQEGILALAQFTALFCINVGVINLLPLPALDGGRLFFILIELIRRKPINIQFENKIHRIGLALLLVLAFLITLNDLRRLFT